MFAYLLPILHVFRHQDLMRRILFFYLTLVGCAWCLVIRSFEVPSMLVPGDSAYLTCLYDLAGEKLYSVKWFKDEQEFYRFFPSLSPQYRAFKAPGVHVDLSKSGPSTVYLTNVSVESEGRFTCQVSADEPFFGCVQIHRNISVYVPPEQSPEISGEITDYGENLTIRCYSAKSKPAANLSWYINDVMMIPEGAVSSQEVVRHQDLLETSSAKLDIPLASSSLPEGILKLACEASISNFVTSVSKELLISREHNDQPPQQHKAPLRPAKTLPSQPQNSGTSLVPLWVSLWIMFIMKVILFQVP